MISQQKRDMKLDQFHNTGSKMIRVAVLTTLLMLSRSFAVAAQPVIKVLQFDQKSGIIDQGENAGLRAGDIFDVNRYAGEFVYWIGRVKVIVVKPKMAGIKTLSLAENETVQPGDVLEMLQRDPEALATPEKDDEIKKNENRLVSKTLTSSQNETARSEAGRLPAEPSPSVSLEFRSGLLQPITNASQSLGLNWSLRVTDASNRVVQVIDMAHAYTRSVTLQGICHVPLSKRMALQFDLAYVPLNIKSSIDAQLLGVGMKASGSLIKIGTAVNYRIKPRVALGLGGGLFLPQVSITGSTRTVTVSDRRWGIAMEATYQFPLTAAVGLKSGLAYHLFRDNGPAIHYFTFQFGPSFKIGKN